VQQLEGSHTKSSGDLSGEGLVRTLKEGLHACIEGDLPAEDAHDQGVSKVAVGLGKEGHAWAVKEVVGVCGGIGYTDEDVEGGRTRRSDGGLLRRFGLWRTLRRNRISRGFMHSTLCAAGFGRGNIRHVEIGVAVEFRVKLLSLLARYA